MSDTNSAASAAPAAAVDTSTPAPETTETPEIEGLEASDNTEEVVETEETTEEAKPTQAEVKKMLKSFELKVNGKSKKVDLDMENEEQVKSYLQKALAADEKFQEASTYKKQAEQLVEMLQNNPMAILKNPALGLDIRKLAEQVLLEDLEEQQKSPEQKKLEEYEKKLKDYEEKHANEEKARKAAQLAESQRRQQEEIENSMIKALEANDIPAEPYFIRRVADVWTSAIESGWEDATLEDIMPYAKSRMDNDFKSLVGKYSAPDKLEKLLGKDVLTNYRKTAVAKVKAAPKTASQVTTDTSKAETKEQAPVKKVKISDIAGW